MKIKLVVLDFEVPTRTKRWALRLAFAAATLGTVGVVLAATAPRSAPKTWEQGDLLTADDLNASFLAVTPVGSISAFAGPIDGNPGDKIGDEPATHLPPAGWLWCNGASLNGLEYEKLYAAIGIAFGGRESSKSFTLPDLRGRFLRGVDAGKERDPDAADRLASAEGGNVGDLIGSRQEDTVQPHTHPIDDPGHYHRVWDAFGVSWAWNSNGQLGSHDLIQTGAVLDTQSKVTGIKILENTGKETRPKNVSINYIIKY